MNNKEKLTEATILALQGKLTEDTENNNYKVADYKRYPNGSEVDIIWGTFENGQQFSMLDDMTGISIYMKGFDAFNIEKKYILDGEELSMDDEESLGDNIVETITPSEQKDIWNKIVSQVDKDLVVKE